MMWLHQRFFLCPARRFEVVRSLIQFAICSATVILPKAGSMYSPFARSTFVSAS